ncbi:hypothetical protein F4823DRAFT_565220 [Ustulina deusta]|nr:hypothetical protein F4823DRAFT_565220 [Ustulina deusta]
MLHTSALSKPVNFGCLSIALVGSHTFQVSHSGTNVCEPEAAEDAPRRSTPFPCYWALLRTMLVGDEKSLRLPW